MATVTKTGTKKSNEDLASAADELGKVKAKIASLEAIEKDLKTVLEAAGVDEVEGSLFKVSVSRFSMERVDYKSVCEELEPSSRLLKKHTTASERVTIKVTSR